MRRPWSRQGGGAEEAPGGKCHGELKDTQELGHGVFLTLVAPAPAAPSHRAAVRCEYHPVTGQLPRKLKQLDDRLMDMDCPPALKESIALALKRDPQ